MALLPSPSALIELARFTVGQVVETAASVATIPVRAVSLLGQAELLVTRITVLADSAEALIGQVATIVTDAQETVASARSTAAAAALTVDEAGAITAGAARIVEQAAVLTSDAGRLIGAAGTTTSDAARLVGEAGTVTAGAAQLVDDAGRITASTRAVLADAVAAAEAVTAVVDRAEAAAAQVTRLLEGYAPMLDRAAPLAARFVDDLTPDEVTAAIRMVDELPRLREHLIDDVMPLLGKLDQVGPDIHNLLGVTQDLHLAITGLPGLRMLRRRGEERVAEAESSAANDSR